MSSAITMTNRSIEPRRPLGRIPILLLSFRVAGTVFDFLIGVVSFVFFTSIPRRNGDIDFESLNPLSRLGCRKSRPIVHRIADVCA